MLATPPRRCRSRARPCPTRNAAPPSPAEAARPHPPLLEPRSPRISRAAPASDCRSCAHPRPPEPRSRIRYRQSRARRSRDRWSRARRSRDRRSRARRSRDCRSRWRVVPVLADPFVSNRLQPKEDVRSWEHRRSSKPWVCLHR
ncbi:uncharacterized protein LOC110431416 [Sorghum bicolor]|uniref:uncharacterized protein LOC110431416 n=1 Tax=Sorghum bicolor TaxID=4558 RepID=UPI000B424F25|nr:uncharacterized protein LOC110431416 [Sorghum bicolor]|eukprot:XP_021306202.1 uncharacterized protein LOC110431416 [Sorghum bicolor]